METANSRLRLFQPKDRSKVERISKLKQLGETQVILYTLGHPENEGTLTFYHEIGFEQMNHENDFFTEGFHRVTFIKKWDQN